jgi:hypothetical protein
VEIMPKFERRFDFAAVLLAGAFSVLAASAEAGSKPGASVNPGMAVAASSARAGGNGANGGDPRDGSRHWQPRDRHGGVTPSASKPTNAGDFD